MGTSIAKRVAGCARNDRCQYRSAGQGLADESGHRSADRRAHGRDHRQYRCRTLSGVRASAGLDDLCGQQSVSRGNGSGAAVLAKSGSAERNLCALQYTRAGAAFGDRALRANDGCACGQSSGPIRGDHVIVQPRRGCCAFNGDPENPRHHVAHWRANLDYRHQSRHRKNFPAGFGKSTVPDSGSVAHGVRGARHALRKLHPSDHDFIDLALGRCRRVAGIDAVQYRALHHRHDRCHFADRHRQKERHSDDRFRNRRRTGARALIARCDL